MIKFIKNILFLVLIIVTSTLKASGQTTVTLANSVKLDAMLMSVFNNSTPYKLTYATFGQR